jgi:hypothetical protein
VENNPTNIRIFLTNIRFFIIAWYYAEGFFTDVRWVGFLPSPFDCDKLFFSSPFSPVQAEAEEKSEAKPKRGGRRAAEVETPAAEPAKRGRRGAAVVEDQVSMFITLCLRH